MSGRRHSVGQLLLPNSPLRNVAHGCIAAPDASLLQRQHAVLISGNKMSFPGWSF